MDAYSLQETAKTIRCLSMDAIQQANSGHPGLPLGCAELGALVYGEFMKHDPADPQWFDRDRFVLSAGHGSMLVYSLLHLSGYDVSLADIESFRQVGSKCPGHPEYGVTPGVETTTGPLGQGVATAVGMAVAETMLAARFNTSERTIVDHYTWVLAGDGCLQEGLSAEAASLAGSLGLGKLIVFYDDNAITIDGNTSLSFNEDVCARFMAYGWHVQKGDAYDADGIRKLVAAAKAEQGRPSLIALKSVIGKGAPTMEGSHKVHGAPLGPEEVARAKAAMGVPVDSRFWVSPDAKKFFATRAAELAASHSTWLAEYQAWRAEEPVQAAELDAMLAGTALSTPVWPGYESGQAIATRNASGAALNAAFAAWPGLVGGSADLTGPNVTALPGPAYSRSERAGRMLHYGIREHAMAAISNGLAIHGGFRPFCATFLVFADYLRPALRLAALMGLPVVYVMTHDSVYIGEDGPTHQPVEHLASLRAIPNVLVLRPADAEETSEAWAWAMARTDGPTVIALTRQNLPVVPKADPIWKDTFRTGAYVVHSQAGEPDVVVLASGSEVSLALAAAQLVPGKNVRVVSVPSLETFLSQPEELRDTIAPPEARILGCEAGRSYGWDSLVDGFMGIDRFGESGPGAKVAAHLGFTAEALAAMIAEV
ncbi:MAG: transketolase [Spirochaetales bacterium]|nr:transketolase [Spirochaetales bacterium]